MLVETRNQVILQECQLKPGDTILVGVSGGPDSLCLVDILNRLGYSAVVAHLDHGLRSESAVEAEKVAQAARAMRLPFRLGEVRVAAFADKFGLSIEEAARTVRYRFLFQQAEIEGAQAVAVGHTADDQVETMLMHLLRGAGLAGLRGMEFRSLPNPWSPTIPLVRPLLDVWREEILEYVQERNLQPNFDASNLDTRFYRNRLRHELIPYLESFNPQVRQRLWRTSQVLHEDYRVLEEMTGAAWLDCLRQQGRGYLALSIPALKAQPRSIQRYLVRQAIYRLQPELRDVDYEAIEKAVRFYHEPSRSAQVDLVAGLRLFIEEEALWLAGWEADLPYHSWPQMDTGQELRLHIPGEVQFSGGWSLRAEAADNLLAVQAQALSNRDPFQAWLDLDALKLPLQIRSRRPGDRFQPLGLGGHSVKLSEYFVNRKLPRRGRDGWPLVISGGEIAWVPGYHLGEPFCLGEKTRHAVKLRLTTISST